MRIAYFTGTYPRATDTFIQREVMALRQRGVTVFTFAVRSPSPSQLVSDQQTAEKARTHYLLPAAFRQLIQAHLTLALSRPRDYIAAIKLAWQTRIPGLKGTLYQLFYLAEAGLLAAQVNQRQIQHLHNHFGDSSCTVAMLAAKLGGFSYSFTLHGPGIFFEPFRWRLDEKIRRASFVSCISHFCRSQAMIFAPIEQWPNLHIVHCGIEPELFQPKQHQGRGQNLLYVGRLAIAKGLPILLESLAQIQRQHPQVQLTVIGDGPDRSLLETQVDRLGLREQVHFLGYQPPEEVRRHLTTTDVFVMSSFAEGVPVVLMEAMAAGVPVVAPQIAGISELVQDGSSGYLVPASDDRLLTERVLTLLQSPDLRQQMGMAGHDFVSKAFNIHIEASKLGEIMTQTLAHAAKPLPMATHNSIPQATGTVRLNPTQAEN